MKKFLLLFLCVCSVFFTASCTTQQEPGPDEIKLPRLVGKTREEMSQILDELGVNYDFYIDNSEFNDNYDCFLRYGNGLKHNDIIKKDKFVRIYTTALELTYTLSDTFTIDFEYEGKSFLTDGVGKVDYVRGVDGDTAIFRDLNGEEIYLRFLGIDTPESTRGKIQPWGVAASNYCKRILSNAKEIVLESEGSRQETYGRYLGWVWVDGRLYNLMCVEEAYSNSICNGSSKYHKYFKDVDLIVSQSGRRFHGEVDPNFNYNK